MWVTSAAITLSALPSRLVGINVGNHRFWPTCLWSCLYCVPEVWLVTSFSPPLDSVNNLHNALELSSSICLNRHILITFNYEIHTLFSIALKNYFYHLSSTEFVQRQYQIIFTMAQHPPFGQALLIAESSAITLRHTTLDSNLLDEWSARRRDLYLTTRNNDNKQTSMPRWDSNPNLSREEAAVLRFRPRGHWDRLSNNCLT